MSPTVPPSCNGTISAVSLDMCSSANLNDADICFFACLITRDPSNAFNPILNSVRDMWDDLDCLAEVVTAALMKDESTRASVEDESPAYLLLDDGLIDLSRRDVIVARQSHVQITLIVA